MARKKKTTQDRQLDRLYEAKGLAEEAVPRLMAKAIARFEKKLDEPCGTCGGFGQKTVKVGEEDVTAECPRCGGDGKGAGMEKEDIMFLRFLQGATLHKERLAEDLGLNPKQLNGGGAKNPLLTIIAHGNLDIKAMTPEDREQLLLDMAGGKQPQLPMKKAEIVE